MEILRRIAQLFKKKEKEKPRSVEVGIKYQQTELPWVRFYSRQAIWKDLTDMDSEEPIVARALDIIARFATMFPEGDVMGFDLRGPDEELEVLMPLLQNTQLQWQSFQIVRDMVLHGNTFCEIILNEDNEIVRLKQFPYSYQIQVNVDEYGNLKKGDPKQVMQYNLTGEAAYEQYSDTGQLLAAFWPYQIVHFAFGKQSGLPYAEPILACATGIWKRLRAKEDGLAIARLTRAYPQRVHKIPVPIQLNYDEVRRKIDSYREQMDVDTTVTYDSTSAGFRMVGQSSPTNVDTDYYLPRLYTPDGKFVDGDVENLPADNPYLTDLDDIYLDLRRLICALNVPLEYLNMRVGQRSFVDKASEEAQESFAYLIRHVQMAYAHGLRQIFDLQLLLKGINPLEAKYEMIFPVVSPIATKRSAQVDAIRANVAMVWAKLGIPAEVIGRSALHLSRDDLERWLQATGGKISTEGLEKWIDYALMQLKPDEEEEGEKEYEPAGADTAATR
ncbi:MAG: hypothetical protein DRO99_01020 [Candidatus Aenigmatarchaeota archaeon]|nr:MAG: hypothetical protein DRO99_01020 [Candidatus Aenigmarchaeota archaeon]